MAFSLKSLFKGKKKARKDSGDGLEDDPFAPSTTEEIPAIEVEKQERTAGKKKKKKKKSGPLAKLLAKLPGKKAGKKTDDGPDPFDNPEVLALIASEVAALPPPEVDDIDEAEAPPPPEARDETAPMAAGPEEDLGPYLEEPEPGEAADDGLPPAPGEAGADGFSAEDEAAFGAFAAMEEDDEAEAEYFRRRRRNSIIGSSLAASLLVALGIGGWWVTGMFGEEEEAMPGSGGLQVYSEADGLAAPQQAQSGDRIRMALPPPPSASGEKSLSRRPWLAEGGPVSGETAGGTLAPAPEVPTAEAGAAGELPEPTETAEAQPPAEEAAAPAEQAAEAEPAVPEPPAEPAPEAAEAPAAPPEAPALAEETGAPAEADETVKAPQLAGLPPLKEPKRPPRPADTPAVPTFTSLAQAQPPGEGGGLGTAPLPGLTRQSPLGPLPVKAPDGRTAWQAYARPFDSQALARVAIIVTGLGLDPEATEAAITRLPPEVTLSFSPYARKLDVQMRKARSYGHEVLLDLPMEPEGFPAQDPGPLAMLTGLPQNDNLTRLETIMGKGVGYTGLLGRFGSKYGASRVHMRTVLESLSQRGLLYVHTAPPEGVTENLDLAVPTAQALLTLDERPFRESIDARLKYLTEAAKTRGVAVGVAHAYPITFERLKRYFGDLEKAGVALAPASAAARLPATAAADGTGGNGRG